MTSLSLPQARIPLGWAMFQGQRVPVEIDIEWMRALSGLLDRTGGVSGSTNFGEYINQFFDQPHGDPAAQEAIRGVDELRNALESARGEVQQLRGMLDDAVQELAALRSVQDLRARIDDLESQLADVKSPQDLRSRVEQIEERLL